MTDNPESRQNKSLHRELKITMKKNRGGGVETGTHCLICVSQRIAFTSDHWYAQSSYVHISPVGDDSSRNSNRQLQDKPGLGPLFRLRPRRWEVGFNAQLWKVDCLARPGASLII